MNEMLPTQSLERQLQEAQKLEAIGAFACGIVHDFNNIVAAILGNTELARQHTGNNALAQESLSEVHKAGIRARELINQIQAFVRRQPTARRPTAVGLVVDESVKLLRALLPAHVAISAHCADAVPPIMGEANQVLQIILNLATNAMQAIGERPGQIHIELDTVELDHALAMAHPELRRMQTRQSGRTVRLAVRDDGPGMSAAVRAKVFEPFFTTKAAGEGTGLGLAVVKSIVNAYEGEILVESWPGRGTCFTLYLPVGGVMADLPAPVAAPPVAEAQRAAGQHVLYIDDDESLAFLVRRLLERRGFRVSAHESPVTALASLRADPAGFDAVVTDYNMRSMSGLDVAREVRAIRPDLPVVVVSGFVHESLREKAIGEGIATVIQKAHLIEDLFDALQGMMSPASERPLR